MTMIFTGGRQRGKKLNDETAPTLQKGGIAGSGCSQYAIDLPAQPVGELPPGIGYAVPPMQEVRARAKRAKLRAASFFAGGGGSSIGHKLGGFQVLYANEFWKLAADTYAKNHDIEPDRRSIVDVQPQDVLAACGVVAGELDLLDGSPPCQTFSTSGKRDMSDDRTDLFDEWIRILRGVMPRAFIAENVSGMVKGVAKGKFKEVLREMRTSGYQVEARVLDAQWLGVPQRRQRIIFIGFRSDLGIDPAKAFPVPMKQRVPLADACPWLRGNTVEMTSHGYFPGSEVGAEVAPAPTLLKGGFGAQTILRGPAPHRLCPSLKQAAEKLADGEQSSKYFSLIKADATRPSPTILKSCGGCAGVIAPGPQARRFTIEEAKRIQSFPDDFDLSPAGSYAHQWGVIGNSVPPLMMEKISSRVASLLRGKVANDSTSKKVRRIRANG